MTEPDRFGVSSADLVSSADAKIGRTVTFVAVVAAVMVLALPALGHVTVRTDNPQPGGFAVYTVRVPNESDSAATTRVEVRIPEGLEASRYEPRPGWSISLEGGVLVVEGGTIEPGQFADFRFQARNPEEAQTLVFPAIQTYDDGEVVNWTGEPGSDTPAAVVELGEASEDAPSADAPEESSARGVLPILGVVFGVLGCIFGAIALLVVQRR